MSTPCFFERLGIVPTGDAKTIKRAYAVALKAIDQEHEGEAFQTLRRAYELALGWVARDDAREDEAGDPDEAEDQNEDEDRDEEEEEEDEDEAGDRDENADKHTDEDADKDADKSADIDIGARLSQPSDSLRSQEEIREQARAVQAALREWMARLLDPRDEAVETLLDQSLKDERMTHLDSVERLEDYIASALHDRPHGRAALFDAAAERFGWRARRQHAAGGRASADWISRVVDQGLSWREQGNSEVSAQHAAMLAAASQAVPTRRMALRLMPVLDTLERRFPQWLVLQLPQDRLQAWRQVYATVPALWHKWKTLTIRAERMTRKQAAGLAVGFFFAVFILQSLVQVSTTVTLFGNGPPAATQSARGDSPAAAGTPAAGAPTAESSAGDPKAGDKVLAYELTGPIDKDSCESADEFVHESNWLEIDDPMANALLTTRALACEDQGKWPRANDRLLACLRVERGAALSARRSENNRPCEAWQPLQEQPR